MIHALLQSLFVQVTAPVVLTQLFGMWMNKRAFDRVMRSFDESDRIFDEKMKQR